MYGFEPRISSVVSDRSTNLATTTAHSIEILVLLVKPSPEAQHTNEKSF